MSSHRTARLHTVFCIHRMSAAACSCLTASNGALAFLTHCLIGPRGLFSCPLEVDPQEEYLQCLRLSGSCVACRSAVCRCCSAAWCLRSLGSAVLCVCLPCRCLLLPLVLFAFVVVALFGLRPCCLFVALACFLLLPPGWPGSLRLVCFVRVCLLVLFVGWIFAKFTPSCADPLGSSPCDQRLVCWHDCTS